MRDVSVLIVDDQPLFRRAAAAVVETTPGFAVVGEAGSGEEAVEQVTELDPRLVLMDINMPGISGMEATRRIVSSHPAIKVLLLSTYHADDLPADAMQSGATAYVNKEEFGPSILIEVWQGRVPGGFAGY